MWTETSSATALKAAFETAEARRAEPREVAQGRVRITVADRSFVADLHNIAAHGMMAEAAQAPCAGARLLIDFGSGVERSGEIRWSRDMLFGVKFDAPLPEDVLVQAMSDAGLDQHWSA